MNRIKIQKVMTQYGYEEDYWSDYQMKIPYGKDWVSLFQQSSNAMLIKNF